MIRTNSENFTPDYSKPNLPGIPLLAAVAIALLLSLAGAVLVLLALVR